MAEKENWDEEMEGSDDGDQPQEDSPAAAAAAKVTPDAGASAEDSPPPAASADNKSDGDLSAAAKPDNTLDSGSARARKAQRTKRAKVVTGSSSATPPEPAAPAPTPPLAAANTPTKTNPKRQAASTPVPIPPQLQAYQNEEGTGDNFLYEEPSKILAGLCCMTEGVLNAFRGAWHLVKGLVQAILRVVFFPALCGVMIYLGLVYLVGSYLSDTQDARNINDFPSALKHVLALLPWVVLPVFAVFLVINFDTHGRHHQFLYESLIDSCMMAFNSLTLATHTNPGYVLWLGPIMIVSAIFRILYWVSLFHMKPKWKTVFKMPAIINAVAFSVFNLGMSLRDYAGGYLGYGQAISNSVYTASVPDITLTMATTPMTPQATDPENSKTGQEGEGWF